MTAKFFIGAALAAASVLAVAGAAAAQDMDGATIVNRRCMLCHSNAEQAPSLKGVVGRPIASIADYGYSDALKAHKEAWSESTLDTFLTNTQAFAAGSWMDFSESDPKVRKAIIDYLKTLK
jgi:cytochrome c